MRFKSPPPAALVFAVFFAAAATAQDAARDYPAKPIRFLVPDELAKWDYVIREAKIRPE